MLFEANETLCMMQRNVDVDDSKPPFRPNSPNVEEGEFVRAKRGGGSNAGGVSTV